MKPRLFNQESKMRLINQKLYKKAKLNIKKLRIQQQTPQPININVNTGNNGFETNRRIKDIYKRLELLAPEEKVKIAFEKSDKKVDFLLKQGEFLKKKYIEGREERLQDLTAREEQLKQQAQQREKEEEIYDEEVEREVMGINDINVNKIKKNKLKEKDKRNNLKELVLMNLNDKSTNSLFG